MREDGELHRLDEVGILHLDGRKPGDFRPLRVFSQWSADWNSDRWAPSRRLGRSAAGLRLRFKRENKPFKVEIVKAGSPALRGAYALFSW